MYAGTLRMLYLCICVSPYLVRNWTLC